MRKVFIITLFLSVQSVWADDVNDELDAAWDKIKMTVSNGDFRSYKSVYHRDAILQTRVIPSKMHLQAGSKVLKIPRLAKSLLM